MLSIKKVSKFMNLRNHFLDKYIFMWKFTEVLDKNQTKCLEKRLDIAIFPFWKGSDMNHNYSLCWFEMNKSYFY